MKKKKERQEERESMKTNIIAGIFIGIISGLVVTIISCYVFYRISDNEEIKKKIATLSEQTARLEGSFQTFVKISDFEKLQKNVDKIGAEVQSLVSPASASILEPHDNTMVQKNFDFRILIRNPLPSKYYYLANRIGGQYWPKFRLFPDNQGIATGQSDEGGNPPNGIFYLTVFEVNEAEHLKIVGWMNGTDFHGMQIDGTKLVERQVRLDN